ncbi:putative zinc finger motif, C2HC5-type-domain-containing protein [Aspergillus pseudoustus]|uniref:Zinc finger motif, C2HC5-type-domain-containing protein n=1 Tax=Aspergillus pseudoustus TaxID=1810923 RepID=A0ABR4JQV7_9EURO
MPPSSLIAWALPRLSEILPLDSESLIQVLTYAVDLSKEEGADHLKNLLGDSPAALEFISAFNSRRDNPTAARNSTFILTPPTSTSATPSRSPAQTPPPGRKNKKSKPPLHSAGPVRRPEDFGNVAGGYMKSEHGDDYISGSASGTRTGRERGDNNSTLGLPSSRGSAASSRAQSPAPPSAAGPMISDLLPNVKSKAAKPSRGAGGGGSGSGTATLSSSKGALTTSNISDLTAAIAALEVSTNPTLGGERRKCTCYATLHPVFDAAPNCLNCGKIICSLEGLQPCSFCGTPLLSSEEIQSMIRELRAERGQEKMRAHNESLHREGGPGMGPAQPQQSGKLDAARAHRDKLLAFQAQNAKRTRVVDEAADFETPNVASTLWMTPSQRALALKKQQRIMREMEEKARPEWEKKKTIMSLDITGGRVRKVYQAAPVESAPAATKGDEETEDLTYDASGPRSGGEAFSRNPLLAAGGLMRPVWKAPKEEKVEKKERKQTWRRVQDDNDDDNEQWILDGGLHGYDQSTTDGAQVEE